MLACLAKFAFHNLSLELSLELERFDRRFPPFGAGITDEVLLAVTSETYQLFPSSGHPPILIEWAPLLTNVPTFALDQCSHPHCKSASELRVERNGLPHQSVRHHVTLLISFSFPFCRCPHHLALDTTRPSSRDTRRIQTTRPNHSPFRLHCLLASPSLSFSLYFTSLVSHSRTTLTTLSHHYYAASVCSLIHPHLSFPLYAYTPYSIPITGTSEIASTIQIL